MTKQGNQFEIVVGTFVLVCAAFFFFNSVKTTDVFEGEGYEIVAKFDNIDGISDGSDVKISGVKVGIAQTPIIDEKTFRAKVVLKISKNIKIPSDSSIRVSSEGLLGSKYLAISPGGDEENLESGDEIFFTQSSVNFEELLGKFIFGSQKDDNKD